MRYSSYKKTGVDWIEEIPAHWEVKKIKHLAFLKSGDTISSDVIEERGQYPVYGGNGLRGYTSSYTHKGNYFLIGRQGALCGNINYAQGAFWASEHAVVVTPFSDVDLVWLGELLRTLNLNQYSVSAAQPGLSVNTIQNLIIPVPPREEQLAIASWLKKQTGNIDDIINTKQKQIDLLQQQRQAVISEAVTKGLDKNVPMKDSGIEWIGYIPKHWNVKRLKYLGEAIIGLTYTPEDTAEAGILVLRSSNVQENRIVFEDNVYVTKEIPQKLITQTGDILICSRNGSKDLIGKNALIDETSAGLTFGAFMTVFRTELWKYMHFVLNSTLFKYQSGSFLTSTINQLTVNNLKNFIVPFPPIDEQNLICKMLDEKVNGIDNFTKKIKSQIVKLKEYRQSLIYEAVTGKIKVS